MTKNWIINGLFIVLFAGLIESNAYTHTPIEAQVFEQALIPAPDKAFIYVYRDSLFGALNSFVLRKDGRRVGETRYGHFYRWEVTPGRHRISSEGGDLALLNLQVEAGHSYFIEETVIGGFSVSDIRPRLELVDSDLGEQSIRNLHVVL